MKIKQFFTQYRMRILLAGYLLFWAVPTIFVVGDDYAGTYSYWLPLKMVLAFGTAAWLGWKANSEYEDWL